MCSFSKQRSAIVHLEQTWLTRLGDPPSPLCDWRSAHGGRVRSAVFYTQCVLLHGTDLYEKGSRERNECRKRVTPAVFLLTDKFRLLKRGFILERIAGAGTRRGNTRSLHLFLSHIACARPRAIILGMQPNRESVPNKWSGDGSALQDLNWTVSSAALLVLTGGEKRMECYLLGIYLFFALALLPRSSGTTAKEITCQEIAVPLCKGIGYNYTYMPNQFNHDTQDEAGLEVHQFWPLVEIQCSPDLKFFLCSMYTPICLEDYKKPLPPCRSVCERAKAGCAPLMRQYGFPWPDRMRCDLLPVQGAPDTLCMDYNRTDSTTVSPVLSKPTNYPSKAFNPHKKKSGRTSVGPKASNPASRAASVARRWCGEQRPTPAVQPRQDGSDPELRHALSQPVFYSGRADFHGLLDRTLVGVMLHIHFRHRRYLSNRHGAF